MLKFLLKNKKQKGFTIIEVLVALFVFSLAVIATMAVLSNGVSSIANAKKKMAAEYLAQEGIEVVRNIRDTFYLANPSDANAGWGLFVNKFNNSCASACFFDNTSISNPTTSLAINPGTTSSGGFTRSIQVSVIDIAKEVKVSSTVSWGTGAGKSVTFSESLFNWKE